MTTPPAGLADAALENLVNQFARPLDFLRELVQNAIDAGSSRVDVRVEHMPEAGVLEIHVVDHGQGMDEAIIDQQLTRLFASSKEDDLSKIGKFGIGFTSVFAMQPELVRVRTGRLGRAWDVLFHADRTWEKLPLDLPVVGTRVTLFKRMDAARAARVAAEAREVLVYWCEHSAVPITFAVGPEARGEAASATDDDPFGAFAEAPSMAPETINRPFGLEHAPVVRSVVRQGTDILLGAEPRPRWGFYNGGLTLVHSHDTSVLGVWWSLAPFSFKVRDRRLEHTLTRDNVVTDTNWHAAMEAIYQEVPHLLADLVDDTARAAAAGEPLEGRYALLARAVEPVASRSPAADSPWAEIVRDLLDHGPGIFRDQDGDVVSVGALHTVTVGDQDILIEAPDAPPGRFPGVRRLRLGVDGARVLLGLNRAPTFFRSRLPWRVLDIEAAFVSHADDGEAASEAERALLRAADRLLAEADRSVGTLDLATFALGANGASPGLVLWGPPDTASFLRRTRAATLLAGVEAQAYVNRADPTFRSLVALSLARPVHAATALAQHVLGLDHYGRKRSGAALAFARQTNLLARSGR